MVLNFCMGFKITKIKICELGGLFYFIFLKERCLKLPEKARTLIGKCVEKLPLVSSVKCRVKLGQTRERETPSAAAEISFKLLTDDSKRFSNFASIAQRHLALNDHPQFYRPSNVDLKYGLFFFHVN